MIAVLSVVGYLAVGMLYARSQALNCWKRANVEWHCESSIREAVVAMQAWRVFFWPYGVVWDTVRGPVYKWMTKPVTDYAAHVKQLQDEAKGWQEKQYDSSASQAERDMAAQLAKFCRDEACRLEAKR